MKKNDKIIDKDLIDEFNDQLNDKKTLKLSNLLHKKAIDELSLNAKKYLKFAGVFNVDLIGLDATDQHRTGTCWLFAATNLLRHQIAKKLNIEDIFLSNAYLHFYDKLERANYFLETIIESRFKPSNDKVVSTILSQGIRDNGLWKMAVNLIEKYGIVPEYVVPPQKQNTFTQDINFYLNWKLKEFASEIRAHKHLAEEKLRSMKEEMMKVIFKFLETFYGQMPTKFTFEYNRLLTRSGDKDYQVVNGFDDLKAEIFQTRDITPLEFYHKYVDVKLSEFVNIVHYPSPRKQFFKKYVVNYINNVIEAKPTYYYNVHLSIFKYLVARQIEHHRLPVWFVADVAFFLNPYSATWDDKLFDYESVFETGFDVQKGFGIDTKLYDFNHDMIFSGFNRWKDFKNKDNWVSYEQFKQDYSNLKIMIWKLQNSWGEAHGDSGYYAVSDSWFDKFAMQALVMRKDLEELLAKLNIKPLDEFEEVQVEVNDPLTSMG